MRWLRHCTIANDLAHSFQGVTVSVKENIAALGFCHSKLRQWSQRPATPVGGQHMDMETVLSLLFCFILSIVFWGAFQKMIKRNDEINRSEAGSIKRETEAAERMRIREENRQLEEKALKKRVLDELKAIASGVRRRFEPDALKAVQALQEGQGEHPETVKAWTAVLDDLKTDILDPNEMENRLGELLYPETLEDIDALKSRVRDAFEKVASGAKSRLDPEALDAAKALNAIRARDERRKREEREAEILERRLQREKDKRFSVAMEEMAWATAREILGMNGLPETAFDGLTLQEALVHTRTLQAIRKHENVEERGLFLRQFEHDLAREREQKSGAREQLNASHDE
jgi:hypothetical protein